MIDMDDLKDVLKDNLEYYLQREKEIVSLLASLPKGRVREKNINDERYFYLQYRKEGRVVDEYIGKEIPDELLASLKKRKALENELKKIKKSIIILKGKSSAVYEFIEPVRNLFSSLTKEELWDEEIEIIGSWCYILYQNYLDVKKYPLRTEDLDILIPFPYKGRKFDLSKLLKDLGFSINFYKDGSLFFTGFGMKIEFLSPEKGKHKDRPVYIKKLQVTPQMLRYLDILLMESIVISIGRGIKVQVPAPAAFFCHKLLVYPKRDERGKGEKDSRQAVYAGEYILKNNDEIKKLIGILSEVPDSWRTRIKRSLKESLNIIPEEESVIQRLLSLIS